VKKLGDKDRLYLTQEIASRNLSDRAAKAKLAATKKAMRSKAWWRYLPLLFALLFLIKRFFGN